jgi:bifunctional enzyme CysN/CysC
MDSINGTVWLTGLPGAGKSTVAANLRTMLESRNVNSVTLDGDVLRKGLSSDLGYSQEDRSENIRRVGELALLLSQAGLLTLVTVVSPYTADRDRARARHNETGVPFFEVHVATPLEVCEERDPKGLYARARSGEIKDMTGVGSPYEVPKNPELVLDTTGKTPEESADEVFRLISSR